MINRKKEREKKHSHAEKLSWITRTILIQTYVINFIFCTENSDIQLVAFVDPISTNCVY